MTGRGEGKHRRDRRLGETIGSAVLLLFSEVASLVTGMGSLFFASIAVAWLVLPTVVKFENVLDAGCFFMLVSLGILIVVDLAAKGQVPLPA